MSLVSDAIPDHGQRPQVFYNLPPANDVNCPLPSEEPDLDKYAVGAAWVAAHGFDGIRFEISENSEHGAFETVGPPYLAPRVIRAVEVIAGDNGLPFQMTRTNGPSLTGTSNGLWCARAGIDTEDYTDDRRPPQVMHSYIFDKWEAIADQVMERLVQLGFPPSMMTEEDFDEPEGGDSGGGAGIADGVIDDAFVLYFGSWRRFAASRRAARAARGVLQGGPTYAFARGSTGQTTWDEIARLGTDYDSEALLLFLNAYWRTWTGSADQTLDLATGLTEFLTHIRSDIRAAQQETVYKNLDWIFSECGAWYRHTNIALADNSGEAMQLIADAARQGRFPSWTRRVCLQSVYDMSEGSAAADQSGALNDDGTVRYEVWG